MKNVNDSDYFNDIYKELCSEIGLENTLEFYRLYRGQQISFPIHLYSSKLIREKIILEYDGTNLRELAKKYDYSEKTVRRMIKSGAK